MATLTRLLVIFTATTNDPWGQPSPLVDELQDTWKLRHESSRLVPESSFSCTSVYINLGDPFGERLIILTLALDISDKLQ